MSASVTEWRLTFRRCREPRLGVFWPFKQLPSSDLGASLTEILNDEALKGSGTIIVFILSVCPRVVHGARSQTTALVVRVLLAGGVPIRWLMASSEICAGFASPFVRNAVASGTIHSTCGLQRIIQAVPRVFVPGRILAAVLEMDG